MSDLDGIRIALVGGGRMAEAIIRGVVTAGARAANIVAADPSSERREHLARACGVTAVHENLAAVAGAAIVVIAVKPKHVRGALAELRGKLAADTVVVSIVAGARLDELAEQLGHAAIVRAMPNTPAMVAQAATVWTATAATSDGQRARARALLRAIGLELEVASEDYVEMATGLSAPMPAFAFLVIEAFIDAGVSLGLSHEQARALTLQTLQGSIELLRSSGDHPAVLRGHVTSPGGATAAGLLVLERAGVRAALHDAVTAVYRRALELER